MGRVAEGERLDVSTIMSYTHRSRVEAARKLWLQEKPERKSLLIDRGVPAEFCFENVRDWLQSLNKALKATIVRNAQPPHAAARGSQRRRRKGEKMR